MSCVSTSSGKWHYWSPAETEQTFVVSVSALSREFWSRKFWSPGPKFFVGKYGPPLEKSVWVEDGHLRPSSQTREYKTTANQRRVSLVSLNAPEKVSNKTKLQQWQAESAMLSF